MLKILQWRNTPRTVMLRTFTMLDVKTNKCQKILNSTPQTTTTNNQNTKPLICAPFCHSQMTCAFALSCVFSLNTPVRVFYKNPLFFPKYDLLLQILSLIMLQLTSLIKCEIVHRTVKNSLLPLSFIFRSLPYSEGQTKTLH